LKGTAYTFGMMDGLWQGRLLVRFASLSPLPFWFNPLTLDPGRARISSTCV
jgi:hypothetical protein